MFCGIDYSLTCPSITVSRSKDFKKCRTFYYTDKKKVVGTFNKNIHGMQHVPYEGDMERINNISEWAMAILKQLKVTTACIEDYSFGSKGRVFHLAENTGLLKWKMWMAGIAFTTPKPTEIKKYFTGKGNANKDAMYASFLINTGVDLISILDSKSDSNPISDIVDSYAMLCYCIDKEGGLV